MKNFNRHLSNKNLSRLVFWAVALSPFGALAAGGEGGHGGGHHEPHIENWFSMGSEHAHAPALGWVIVTFLVFVGAIIKFAGPALTQLLERRHLDVKNAIEEAKKAREEAEAKKAEYDARLKSLDDEIKKLKDEFETRGKAEMARLEEAGKKTAERILKDAEDTIGAEYARAEESLKAEAARLALELAESRIKSAVNDDDEARLRKDFVGQLAG